MKMKKNEKKVKGSLLPGFGHELLFVGGGLPFVAAPCGEADVGKPLAGLLVPKFQEIH